MPKKLPTWLTIIILLILAGIIAYILYLFVIIPLAETFNLDDKYRMSLAFIAFLGAILLISQTVKPKKKEPVQVQKTAPPTEEDVEAKKIKGILNEM